MRVRLACVLALAIVAFAGGSFAQDRPAQGNSAQHDPAQGDLSGRNFVSVAIDDPDMAAAKKKARETLSGFLNLAKAPGPATKDFAVKIGIREGGHTEFFWVAPFEEKDGQFSGTVNSRPRLVRSVSFGQRITFAETDVADWLYIDGKKMKGNYTACAIIKHEPAERREAFMKRHGLDCDL